MKLTIEHHTEYRYDEEVRRSTQYLRLTPRPSARQRVLHWQLEMPDTPARGSDGFGNILHVLSLDRPHREIRVRAHGEVEIDPAGGEDADRRLSPLVFLRCTPMTRPDEALRDLAGALRGQSLPAALERLSQRVLEAMPYTPGATSVTSTAGQALAAGQGVCQDHTHVFLSCCRLLGLPARYVSGYLYTPDSTHVASHAWAEVWHGDCWHTFDITNQALRPRNHLKLAVGLDYMDACPVRGVRFGGGAESLSSFALVERSDGSVQ